MRRGHQPIHTTFAKQEGSRERERERERDRVSTWVDGNLRSGKGFVWVTIAIGSGAGVVINWDNWGVDKRCFVPLWIQVRGLSSRREGKCGFFVFVR